MANRTPEGKITVRQAATNYMNDRFTLDGEFEFAVYEIFHAVRDKISPKSSPSSVSSIFSTHDEFVKIRRREDKVWLWGLKGVLDKVRERENKVAEEKAIHFAAAASSPPTPTFPTQFRAPAETAKAVFSSAEGSNGNSNTVEGNYGKLAVPGKDSNPSKRKFPVETRQAEVVHNPAFLNKVLNTAEITLKRSSQILAEIDGKLERLTSIAEEPKESKSDKSEAWEKGYAAGFIAGQKAERDKLKSLLG